MKSTRQTRRSLRSSVLSQNVGGNKTILLDSSDETDIIECSVEETGDRCDILRTPRSNLKRSFVTESRNDIISLNDVKVKRDKIPEKNNSSLRKSLKNLDDVSIISESSVGTRTKYLTPSRPLSEISKLISTIKKTPDVPFLTKSKLQNIEKWLYQNDIETVKTPPFANLSVTPTPAKNPKTAKTPKTVAKTPKSIAKTPKTERKRKASDSDSNSIDSEVSEVLRAVYGEDWKAKNVLKKCRTEPKKKPNVPTETKTEVKPRRGRPPKTPQPVRRNILGSETPKPLDDSIGVEEIDLDRSEDFAIAKNFSGVKRKKRKDDEDDADSISSYNLPKRKKTETPKPLSGKKTKEGSEAKTPKKSFLASLNASTPTRRCHPEAQYYKMNFKTKKEELAKKLYKLYNSEVFEDKLPSDMSLSWNVYLRGTAGFCYNKKLTKSTGEVIRFCKIEFSTKVIDRADRLRDTLIHEMCHAATWVIDGALDGHGSVWKKWSRKALLRFPELPSVKRCHNYEIMSKYTYRCTKCGYSINRHSKSIDIERKRCGYCYGTLELLVNKQKRGKTEVPEFHTTRTIRTPNNFALFVKENYHSVKSTKEGAKHAEIMKILSQQYAIIKNAGTPQPLPTTT